MKSNILRLTIVSMMSLSPAVTLAAELTVEKAEIMGRVEDFFLHNFRDVTLKKSLAWGEVETLPNGDRSIRYQYEARIWDKDAIIANQVFTFDKNGKFVSYKNVPDFPKKKEIKVADVQSRKGLMDLVEEFFGNNFRDITSREAIEWGEPKKQSNGNVSIRYKYCAKIRDKETKIMDQVFTFDSKGKFVSVKDASGQVN